VAARERGTDARRKTLRPSVSSGYPTKAGVTAPLRDGPATRACKSPRIGPTASTSATPAASAKQARAPITPKRRTVDDTAMPEFGEERVDRRPVFRALLSGRHRHRSGRTVAAGGLCGVGASVAMPAGRWGRSGARPGGAVGSRWLRTGLLAPVRWRRGRWSRTAHRCSGSWSAHCVALLPRVHLGIDACTSGRLLDGWAVAPCGCCAWADRDRARHAGCCGSPWRTRVISAWVMLGRVWRGPVEARSAVRVAA
jgi:hypothetical protein